MSSHLIDEIAGLLEDVLVLDAGRLLMAGAADDLRARACVLTGPIDAVESVIRGLPVLHREAMAGHESVTVNVNPDADLRRQVAGLGIEIGSVSLQNLVVHSGQRRTTEGAAR